MEIWKEIPGTEYSVSNEGHVASRKKGWLVLRPSATNNGYLHVDLCTRGTPQTRLIHQLVAEAFIGLRPTPKHEVNHENGIKTDNRAENLEWCTSAENKRHKIDILHHGCQKGAMNVCAKMIDVDVREIRRRCAAGELQRVVAADYGIHQAHVSAIIRGKRWGWLAK